MCEWKSFSSTTHVWLTAEGQKWLLGLNILNIFHLSLVRDRCWLNNFMANIYLYYEEIWYDLFLFQERAHLIAVFFLNGDLNWSKNKALDNVCVCPVQIFLALTAMLLSLLSASVRFLMCVLLTGVFLYVEWQHSDFLLWWRHLRASDRAGTVEEEEA